MISNTLLESVMIPIAGLFIILDAEDVDRVMEHNWFPSSCGKYPLSRQNQKTVYLHRFLLRPPSGFQVDHINGQTWDNRKSNLRLATRSQNNQNARKHADSASKYKGVSVVRRKKGDRYRATITIRGKVTNLGHFDDEIAAARAYDRAALEHFGEYARINFID